MVEMKKILLVIADSSRALFYIAHGPQNILQINEINNPEGHINENVKIHFSKSVVTQIDKMLESQHLDELCLVAPPHFMGLINKGHLRKHIKITEFTKEFQHLHTIHHDDLQKLIHEAGLNFMPS